MLMMMIVTDGGIPILLYTRLFCCIVPDTMAVVDGRDMGLGPSRLASGQSSTSVVHAGREPNSRFGCAIAIGGSGA